MNASARKVRSDAVVPLRMKPNFCRMHSNLTLVDLKVIAYPTASDAHVL